MTSTANERVIALVREAMMLRKHYPDGSIRLRASRLRWTGELQPSEISRQYLVDVRYAPPNLPRIVVRRPKLVANADGLLPHIYPDGGLCLFEPGQWAHGDPIAETILPWTCEWLLHYEFWRATGEWCGSGGDHFGPIGVQDRPHRPSTGRRVEDCARGRKSSRWMGSTASAKE